MILTRFLALPAHKRRLLVEAVAALWIAALLRLALPFRYMTRLVSHPAPPFADDNRQAELIAEISWAITAAAHRVPWRALCYEQGFAAQWLLRRRAVPVTLYYGVTRKSEDGLAAHVWARAGQMDVIGCVNLDDYAELARFPGTA